MRALYSSLVVLALVLSPAMAAQAQTSIPPEVRSKMSGYVGTWDVEEWVREGPSGSEVLHTGTWQARWVYDSFIGWRGDMTSEGETTTSIEFEGYDPVKQTYTYWFASDGSRGEAYDGEWDGNTLTIQSVEFTAEGEAQRGRCTWPYSADFTELQDYFCEKLTDGNWWVFRRGSAQKADG